MSNPDSFSFVLGQIVGSVILISIPVIFGITLYKYIKTKERFFLISSIVSGIPTGLFILLLMAGMVLGLVRGINSVKNAGGTSGAVDLNSPSAKWEYIKGKKYGYKISLPEKNKWRVQYMSGDSDLQLNCDDLYLQVIPEKLDVESTDKLCEIVRSNLNKNAQVENVVMSEIESVMLNGLEWKKFDATLKTNGISLKFRWYVYGGKGIAVQLMFWTSLSEFTQKDPLIGKIANSFDFDEFKQ